MRNRKEEGGGATSPSSSLGLFWAGGANRGDFYVRCGAETDKPQ